MIDVARALELLEENIAPLESTWEPTGEALFRVAARNVEAGIDLPPFAQSAMDGYALYASDLAGASAEEPVSLEVTGEVAAGESGELDQLEPGCAVRVFTGGRIPPGADTVVRQERVRREGDCIIFEQSFDEGGDLRPVGEELDAATALVEAGTRLDERHLAALSMTGHERLEVHCEPHITLLISGDEVVPAGSQLRPGQIYDANTPFLAAWLRARGYASVDIVYVADERDEVRRELSEALDRADLVVSTGGVSVGDYDFLVGVADEVGLETIFWRLRQKPGKPLLFARRDETPFLGIPGNPGAVFVSAHVYLRRALDLLEGVSESGPKMRTGRLTEPVSRSRSKLKWVGCRVDVDEGGVLLLEPVAGHRLSQLFRCDGLARIEAGEGRASAGAKVRWLAV